MLKLSLEEDPENASLQEEFKSHFPEETKLSPEEHLKHVEEWLLENPAE